MKLYVVVGWTQNNEKITNLNNLFWGDITKSCEYIGTNYTVALSRYKSVMRWRRECQFISIDMDNSSVADLTTGENVDKERKAIITASDYCTYMYGVFEYPHSKIIRDGNITIVLPQDVIDPSRDDENFKNKKQFRIKPEVRLDIIKRLTDRYVKENNVTNQMKINYKGKTICIYNKK